MGADNCFKGTLKIRLFVSVLTLLTVLITLPACRAGSGSFTEPIGTESAGKETADGTAGTGGGQTGGTEKTGMTEPFMEFLGIMEECETVSRTETGDGGYVYSLDGGVLSVCGTDGAELWRSKDEWWVDDFRLGDVDGDGRQDVVFTLWKSYRFGNVFPARMENDDETVRNHLFLYTVISGYMKPVWCSSALPRPICGFGLDPFGKVTPVNSGMLLITEEGEYTEDFSRTETVTYVYAWQKWGFVEVTD